jgi:hypothetical protein
MKRRRRLRKNPAEHRTLHMVTELGALVLLAPLSWHVAKNPALPEWQRRGLQATALVTVLVDGWLFYQWYKRGPE